MKISTLSTSQSDNVIQVFGNSPDTVTSAQRDLTEGSSAAIDFSNVSSQSPVGSSAGALSSMDDVMLQAQSWVDEAQTNLQQVMAANDPAANITEPSENNGMSFAEVVTTLGRHDGLMKKAMDADGLEKLKDDPATPSDMKAALDTLLNNPAMYQAIDEATPGKVDGKLAAGDIDALKKTPAFMQYADQMSESYTHDYIPSDAKPGSPPREMTANDAARELYLYSQSLPKKLSLDTMRDIANGSQSLDKCPPQVAAAAKYFTDHPNQWTNLTGMSDASATESREALCDQVSYNVKLSKPESDALQTVKNNEDVFFKDGSLTPKKLQDVANDSNQPQDVRDAANLLSQPNSMLFSMLDNGKHHAGGNFFNKSNDQKISKGDLDAFIAHGTNQVAAAPTLAKTDNASQQKAKSDMDAGQETQPDQKKEMGGGVFKMLDIFSWIGTGLSILIPGLGEAALGAGVGRAAVQAGVEAGVQAGAETAAKEGVASGIKAGMSAAKQAGINAGKAASAEAEAAGEKGIGFAAVNTGERATKSGAEIGVNQGTNHAVQSGSQSDDNAGRVWAQS